MRTHRGLLGGAQVCGLRERILNRESRHRRAELEARSDYATPTCSFLRSFVRSPAKCQASRLVEMSCLRSGEFRVGMGQPGETIARVHSHFRGIYEIDTDTSRGHIIIILKGGSARAPLLDHVWRQISSRCCLKLEGSLVLFLSC